MKEVMAFIRIYQINQTKKALADAGFPSLTCRTVLGRGKKKVEYSLQSLPEDAAKKAPKMLEAVSEEHRLVPKRFLTLIIRDEDVKRVVDTIMKVNSTGHPGDGKIFILPITDVCAIRTGATGEEAI